MDILRVAQHVHPDRLGGASYHVHALSRDQAARGHDVTVLTTADAPASHGTTERTEYTLERVRSGPSPLGNDLSIDAVGYLRTYAEEFDVIHAHSHLYVLSTAAAVFSGSTPVAITNHGLFSQRVPKPLFELHLRTLGRVTFNRADRVFVYTETDRDRLRSRGVRAPTEVIPNGVDTGLFTPDGPAVEFGGTGPHLLFAGRLVDGKRPGLAIDAIERLRETYPRMCLHLAGDGPMKAALEKRQRRLTDPDAVTFHGHVPYERMPALLRGADLVILPSRTEGLPRILLESLACGTPIVASALPTFPDAFDDCGRLVGTQTAEAFARAVCDLLDRDLDVLGERGRDLVTTTYDWDRTVDRTTAALEEIVDHRP